MRRLFRLVALAASGFGMPHAVAHGGLSMDQDKCKLALGRYQMHFAGYQLDAQRSEFCEDIPHTGETIIVLDAVDLVLRDLPIEVVITRARPGSNAPDEVVFRLPPTTYPKGTLTVQHDFRENGNYIGLVYAGDNRQHVAMFPFAVGRDRRWIYALGSIALLALLGAGGYVIGRQRLRKSIEEAVAS